MPTPFEQLTRELSDMTEQLRTCLYSEDRRAIIFKMQILLSEIESLEDINARDIPETLSDGDVLDPQPRALVVRPIKRKHDRHMEIAVLSVLYGSLAYIFVLFVASWWDDKGAERWKRRVPGGTT